MCLCLCISISTTKWILSFWSGEAPVCLVPGHSQPPVTQRRCYITIVESCFAFPQTHTLLLYHSCFSFRVCLSLSDSQHQMFRHSCRDSCRAEELASSCRPQVMPCSHRSFLHICFSPFSKPQVPCYYYSTNPDFDDSPPNEWELIKLAGREGEILSSTAPIGGVQSLVFTEGDDQRNIIELQASNA